MSSTIAEADALLSRFSGKLPYRVKRSSPPGEAMATDVAVLRDYNLGNLTPGCDPAGLRREMTPELGETFGMQNPGE